MWVSSRSGGGPIMVATDALLAHTERLARLHRELAANAATLNGIAAFGVGSLAATAGGAPGAAAAMLSVAQVDGARVAVRAAAEIARRVDADLRRAISGYTAVEEQQRVQAEQLGGLLGTLCGPAIRGLLIASLPALVFAGAVGLDPEDLPLDGLKRWLLNHPELITDPAFVEGVRTTVMSLDEATGSILGLPPGTVQQLAADHGFIGVEVGAAITMIAGRPMGFFQESAVSVERVSTTRVAHAPSGTLDRLSRIPEGDQLRIERYDAPGQPPRYVVYVGPTETFSPTATDEPWDLTSNVAAVAGVGAGSLRATELAMHNAGISAADEVQFIGFSQGGLIATRLAGSESWNAVGLETYGAPAGGITLPHGLHGMAIRNTDDFIPALAGPQLDHHLLQVERRAYAPGTPIPTSEPAPAHQRNAYAATAMAVDGAKSDAVRQEIAAMDAFTADYVQREGSSITAMTFHAERGGLKQLGPERALATTLPHGSIP